MKHRQMGGRGRHFTNPDNLSEHHHRGRHRHHHGGRHGGRLFDYGELRLLLLAMIAERPRHGYELIKAIEERFGGSYTPSPGVMYPTLSWLDDMGYAAIEAEEGGRKRYRITTEGEAFLVANRAAADALLSRAGPAGADRRRPRAGAGGARHGKSQARDAAAPAARAARSSGGGKYRHRARRGGTNGRAQLV